MPKLRIIRTSRDYLESFRQRIDDIWPELLDFLQIKEEVKKPRCLINKRLLDGNYTYDSIDNTIYLPPFTRSTIRAGLSLKDEDVSDIGELAQNFLQTVGGIEGITEKEAVIMAWQFMEELVATLHETFHSIYDQICQLPILKTPPLDILKQSLWYDIALAKIWREGLAIAAIYSFPYKFPISKKSIYDFLKIDYRNDETRFVCIPYFTRNANRLQEWIYLKEPIINNKRIQRTIIRYAKKIKRSVYEVRKK